MKCDFCGAVFYREAAKGGCKGCPMNKGCGRIKCPNCNYEMLPEPEIKLFTTLKKWGRHLWRKQWEQRETQCP
jgi:hypothetical protein